MFHLVTNAIGKLWGGGENTEDPEEESSVRGTSIGGLGATESTQENTDSIEHSLDGNPSQSGLWQFIGQVTSLHDGYGLVDHQVYFSFNITTCVPPVGTKVQVTAHRTHEESGWQAKSLRSVAQEPNWDNASETSSQQSASFGSASTGPHQVERSKDMIAIVTRVNKDGGYLNETLSFRESCVKPGYVAHKDDWVVAETQVDKMLGHTQVLHIRPLRECYFEAEISFVKPGFGYINSDIYFTFGVCENGFNPCRGDKVCGKAVESGQRRCNWRAVKVVLLRKPRPPR